MITGPAEIFPCIVRFLPLNVMLLFLSVVLLYVPGLSVIVLLTSLPLATVLTALLTPPASPGLIVTFTALADDKQMNNIVNNIVEIIIFLIKLSLFFIFSPPFYIIYRILI
ncbi:hypothetical protein KQY27_00585 [Methanobrevibacter sp. TMH8]|uniref:hypothetical protein n=1 Tax=Methanobrevibacter sp. TMH8 TaxID=2848611 RepID=UPI001CCA1BD6|nr:hypothetical protein [Methanobrevibacter sp. TMH8]MBZ9570050.1 hypothetical protein [Methanobrevibacter sp. TMH8]